MWLLFLFDVLVIVLHYIARQKLGFFDLDKEGNLVSLYSGIKLWGVGTLGLLHAYILHRAGAMRGRAMQWILWALFGMGVAYIGIDDMMVLHERIGFVVNNVAGTGGFYGESFNWLFYFAPFMVVAVVVFGALVRSLWSTHRRAAWWFFGGLTLWIAALGVELYGRQLLLSPIINVPVYQQLIVLEEALEMFGASCFAVGVVASFERLLAEKVRIG